jgi:hypothetical protein
MSQLKYYDSGSSSWVPAVIGAQGVAGINGNNGVGYDGIVTTDSVTGTTGSKSFTVNRVGALGVGTRIRLASAANPTTRFFEGVITAIASLVISVTADAAGSSATAFTDGAVSVAGAAGLQGTTGAQGTQGIQGTQGTQGATGIQGTTGEQGVQGTQGVQGLEGLQGVQGTVPTSVPSTTNTNAAKSFGYRGLPQVTNPNSVYNITEVDAGKHIYMTTTGRTIEIPANVSNPLEIGTTFVVINGAGVTTTISIESPDSLLLASTGTTGSRTLGAHGMSTCVKITSISWIISGNGLT